MKLAQPLPALQLEGRLGFMFYSSRLKFSTISTKGLQVFIQCWAWKILWQALSISRRSRGTQMYTVRLQGDSPASFSKELRHTVTPLDESVLGQESRLRAALGQVIASSVHLGRCAGCSSTMRGKVRGNMTQQVSKGSQGIWAECQRALLLLSINDLSWIIRRHV